MESPRDEKKQQESVRQVAAREARRPNDGPAQNAGQVQSLADALILSQEQITVGWFSG